MMPDDDLGVVRVRAFRTYDFRIADPETFRDALALIQSGELPAKKIGSSYRIKRSELEAYLSR